MNPLWSVKDRIGRAMIDAAERDGKIKDDTVIIEPTSGNTGIGLAYVCAARGYKLMVTMPESMSARAAPDAQGAGRRDRSSRRPPKACPARSARPKSWWPQNKNYFMPQQFKNPANPEVHRKTTAEEIWRDTDGKVDILVSRRRHRRHDHRRRRSASSRASPAFKAIAVEPVNSPVITQKQGRPGAQAGPAHDPGHRRRLHPRRAERRHHRRSGAGAGRRRGGNGPPAGQAGRPDVRHQQRRRRLGRAASRHAARRTPAS